MVDDEKDLQSLVKMRLRRDIRRGDYEFRFALDGEEAVEILSTDDDIDIIVTDIKGIVLILPMLITIAYHGMFRILDSTISRRRELRCDEIAAEVYGHDHISNGLLKVVGYGTLLSENIDGQFVSLLSENRIFQNYPGWFSYFASEESSRSAVSRILSYAAAAKTRAADSHPALAVCPRNTVGEWSGV